MISPHREVPIRLCEKFDKLLLELQIQNIIEDISGPVEWILKLVLAPKRNSVEIRFTVDMAKPSKVITIEDVKAVFRGATVFSKIDMKINISNSN